MKRVLQVLIVLIMFAAAFVNVPSVQAQWSNSPVPEAGQCGTGGNIGYRCNQVTQGMCRRCSKSTGSCSTGTSNPSACTSTTTVEASYFVQYACQWQADAACTASTGGSTGGGTTTGTPTGIADGSSAGAQCTAIHRCDALDGNKHCVNQTPELLKPAQSIDAQALANKECRCVQVDYLNGLYGSCDNGHLNCDPNTTCNPWPLVGYASACPTVECTGGGGGTPPVTETPPACVDFSISLAPRFTAPAAGASVPRNQPLTISWTSSNNPALTRSWIEIYPAKDPAVDLTYIDYNNLGIALSGGNFTHQDYAAEGNFFHPSLAFDLESFTYYEYGHTNNLSAFPTFWASSQSGAQVTNNAWLGFNFGTSPRRIGSIAIQQWPDAKNQVNAIAIEASNNGTSWTELHRTTQLPKDGTNTVRVVTIPNPPATPYQYYRVRALAPATEGYTWVVQNLEFRGVSNVTPIQVDMAASTYTLQSATATDYYIRVAGSRSKCREQWSDWSVPTNITTTPPTTTTTPPTNPTVAAACRSASPIVNINWSGTFSSDIWIDFDDDADHNNGYWNYNVKTPNTTKTAVAPDNFVTKWFASTSKQENAAAPVMQAGKTYYVRVFDVAKQKGSDWVTVNTNTCATTTTATNPPVGGFCVNLFASTTSPKRGDDVTFTCAQVANAARYEFRVGYSTQKTAARAEDIAATLERLEPKTATSRESEPLKIDRAGKYMVQCRPCFANNNCVEWEPLSGSMGAPQLPNENTNYDTNRCWDQVIAGPSWPDGCAGAKPVAGVSCTSVVTALTQDETRQYNAWLLAGRPAITGCSAAAVAATTTTNQGGGGVATTRATAQATVRATAQATVPAGTGTATYNREVCWNWAQQLGSTTKWPTHCRGDRTATQCPPNENVPLTSAELVEYRLWIQDGRPLNGCAAQATITYGANPSGPTDEGSEITSASCWNRVQEEGIGRWIDGDCSMLTDNIYRQRLQAGQCGRRPRNLTNQEVTVYRDWLSRGKPRLRDCTINNDLR